jgi:hypothetical protein
MTTNKDNAEPDYNDPEYQDFIRKAFSNNKSIQRSYQHSRTWWEYHHGAWRLDFEQFIYRIASEKPAQSDFERDYQRACKADKSPTVGDDPYEEIVLKWGLHSIRDPKRLIVLLKSNFLPRPKTCGDGDLLPCPFCGEAPELQETDPGAPYPGSYFEITCQNEGCTVNPCASKKIRLDDGTTRENAWQQVKNLWNTRAVPDMVEKEITDLRNELTRCKDALREIAAYSPASDPEGSSLSDLIRLQYKAGKALSPSPTTKSVSNSSSPAVAEGEG